LNLDRDRVRYNGGRGYASSGVRNPQGQYRSILPWRRHLAWDEHLHVVLGVGNVEAYPTRTEAA